MPNTTGPPTPPPDDDDKGGYRQINKALNICAFDDYLKSQVASLPRLSNVEQITPRVLRVLGQNPGKVEAVWEMIRAKVCANQNSSRSKARTRLSSGQAKIAS